MSCVCVLLNGADASFLPISEVESVQSLEGKRSLQESSERQESTRGKPILLESCMLVMTTSLATHFKKLTTGDNVFIVAVIV